jgi:hypothetical protein
MDARREAEQERGELADLLEGLSEEQWEAPSLCEGGRSVRWSRT